MTKQEEKGLFGSEPKAMTNGQRLNTKALKMEGLRVEANLHLFSDVLIGLSAIGEINDMANKLDSVVRIQSMLVVKRQMLTYELNTARAADKSKRSSLMKQFITDLKNLKTKGERDNYLDAYMAQEIADLDNANMNLNYCGDLISLTRTIIKGIETRLSIYKELGL